METGQLTGESTEGGSTSIAEELLRAIMENPQSTPDKVTIPSTFYRRKFLVLNLVLFAFCYARSYILLDNFSILFLEVEDLKDTLVTFTNFHITLRKTVFLKCFQQNKTWTYRVCKMFIDYLRQKERFLSMTVI